MEQLPLIISSLVSVGALVLGFLNWHTKASGDRVSELEREVKDLRAENVSLKEEIAKNKQECLEKELFLMSKIVGTAP